jgi:acetyl/propionyl-CoA carboxylase alpha subunit
LVRAQIGVAAGEPLPWSQAEIGQRGHAIEVRIYAEDPANGYLPQAGPVLLYREPSMPGVRVDSGICQGSDVSVHYDPLLAKLIARGETRDAARRRAIAALRAFPILGLRTNQALLLRILQHDRFLQGDLDTHFLEQEHEALVTHPAEGGNLARAQAVARVMAGLHRSVPGAASTRGADPWEKVTSFRG